MLHQIDKIMNLKKSIIFEPFKSCFCTKITVKLFENVVFYMDHKVIKLH